MEGFPEKKLTITHKRQPNSVVSGGTMNYKKIIYHGNGQRWNPSSGHRRRGPSRRPTNPRWRTDAILKKKRYIAISLQQFDRFWWHLARRRTLAAMFQFPKWDEEMSEGEMSRWIRFCSKLCGVGPAWQQTHTHTHTHTVLSRRARHTSHSPQTRALSPMHSSDGHTLH